MVVGIVELERQRNRTWPWPEAAVGCVLRIDG